MVWCHVEFLNKNSVALVINSHEYQFKDYIETYNEFLRFQKKNK